MGGITFSWEVEGLEQINRSLSRYGEYLQDLTDAWPDIKNDFYKGEEIQFDSEMGEGPWKDLSEPYASWKAKHYPGKKIMELTGRLRNALTGGGSDLGWKEDPQKLSVIVKVPYAKLHHEGLGKLPRREVIWFTEDTKRAFTSTLQKWAVKKKKEAELD